MDKDKLAVYDNLVEQCPRFERKLDSPQIARIDTDFIGIKYLNPC